MKTLVMIRYMWRIISLVIVESVINASLDFLGTGLKFGMMIPDEILNRNPFDATSIFVTVTSL